MVLAVRLRILLICLLHFCTCAVGEDVNPDTLMRIVRNFEKQLGNMGQYAVAFRVEKDKCQASDYSGPDLTQVKQTLQKNEVYKSNDLIAARAGEVEHSEFRLKNYLKNVLNVADKCVVYFTVSSPCLNTCLSESGKYNIKDSLKLLQKYVGIKALAFKKIWTHDNKGEVIKRLKAIAPALPYYQCEMKKCDRQ